MHTQWVPHFFFLFFELLTFFWGVVTIIFLIFIFFQKADWDSEYGGGWTMVGRGVGGNPDCWLQAGEEGCNAWSMWDTRKSFMYKDNTINGIPHTAIWYQGYGTIKASFYYESNSETGEGCQYGHATAASNACNCPHDTPDFEGDCPQGMLYEGHNGVGHWSEQENGADVDGFLHSSIAGGAMVHAQPRLRGPGLWREELLRRTECWVQRRALHSVKWDCQPKRE